MVTLTRNKRITPEDLCTTEQAVPNIPDGNQREQLWLLILKIVEPIVEEIGDIYITSGFRSQALQDALKAKGYPTAVKSQHLLGQALDFVPISMDIKEAFYWCKDSLFYGQIIFEKKKKSTWIHISLPDEKHYMQALIYDNGKYSTINSP